VEYEKFQQLLESEYTFPVKYLFKFVMPPSLETEVLKAIDGGVLVKTNSSKNGRFISLTVSKEVFCSIEIVEVYKRVALINGVIGL